MTDNIEEILDMDGSGIDMHLFLDEDYKPEIDYKRQPPRGKFEDNYAA